MRVALVTPKEGAYKAHGVSKFTERTGPVHSALPNDQPVLEKSGNSCSA